MNGESRSPFIVHPSSFIVLFLFLAARIPLLFFRQPFFDERFTQWITARPYGAILDALRLDSGPPLYYWLIKAIGNGPLLTMRTLSFVFSLVAMIAILGADRLGDSRFGAAALVAVFPPAVLFSVDARAYALCAMFVTIGIVALVYEKPYVAAAAFVLAGYSHYYGALFLLLLIRHIRALVAAAVVYAPAVWLALHQPRAAMGWMKQWTYPDALFVRPPLVLIIVIAGSAAVSAAGWAASRRPEGQTRAPLWTLIPFASAVVIGVYVPLRFEAVAAVPLALWLAQSGRRLALVVLGIACAAWTALGIAEHVTRQPDDYAAAAAWVAEHVPADQPVVASGYLFLETVVLRPASAFPAEQAQHPGWRAVARDGSGLPPGMFIWVGERAAPELQIIRRTRRIAPLFVNSRAAVVQVN